MKTERLVEDRLKELAPRVLGVLARRYGQFDAAEDAVQEALLAAATQWTVATMPDEPFAWLLAVAHRRLIDEWRSESARRRREEAVANLERPTQTDVAELEVPDRDDTVDLLFLCCHPSLSAPSQLALTLRAVGGLTTAEIASAFLVPETTMAQRISRAKQMIRLAGARFESPPAAERAERLRVVLQVLYLIFNEGYTASSGDRLQRAELATEAIRLTRMLCSVLPDENEAAGLLALMLLTDARKAARTTPAGELVPLSEQRRELWDRTAIDEGIAIISSTLGKGAVGAYQLQAAIAAVHDEAASDDTTDWPQILALYGVLEHVSPGPVVTLNRAVAVAMVEGPRAGLELVDSIAADERMSHTHRVDAVRAHLLERAGDHPAAREAYLRAASRSPSIPEQRYLALRAAQLGGPHTTR